MQPYNPCELGLMLQATPMASTGFAGREWGEGSPSLQRPPQPKPLLQRGRGRRNARHCRGEAVKPHPMDSGQFLTSFAPRKEPTRGRQRDQGAHGLRSKCASLSTREMRGSPSLHFGFGGTMHKVKECQQPTIARIAIFQRDSLIEGYVWQR
jgi:hypothetical protein